VTGECSHEARQHSAAAVSYWRGSCPARISADRHKGSPLRDGRLDGALVQVVHQFEGRKTNPIGLRFAATNVPAFSVLLSVVGRPCL
jgi:hypothetical protein